MTLTQTAILTKKVMLFSTILLVISISGWVGFNYYYYNIYLPSVPKPEIKPEVKFGVLPSPLLPKTINSATNYSYTLDTQTGDLPLDIPKILTVYFVPERSITLLDSNRAGDLSKRLGFTIGPDVLSPTKIRYSDQSGGTITIDLNTGNFNFQKNTASDSAFLTIGTLPNLKEIESSFKAYLRSRNLLRTQLENGKLNAVYDQTTQKNSSNATVSIWQNDVNEYPVVTPSFKDGNIKALVVNGSDNDRHTKLDYTYWQIDLKTQSTYPLKKVSEAYSELKNGEGSIVLAPNTPKVSLQLIYLAYYLSEEHSPYLQPVFVFEGENFAAYVPAIASNYLE